ncbi:MAG: hypothetical protein ACRDSN_13900, partial [Pseudonocardiaceae bacterium]
RARRRVPADPVPADRISPFLAQFLQPPMRLVYIVEKHMRARSMCVAICSLSQCKPTHPDCGLCNRPPSSTSWPFVPADGPVPRFGAFLDNQLLAREQRRPDH